ncbi:MAG: RNA-binding domain-containing protein [Candidatus Helarchaeota archaeon]
MTDIKEIEIETFIQATEDPEKVKIALKNLIPMELQEEGIEFMMQSVRGVFHNPITIIKLKKTQNVLAIVKYIMNQLSDGDRTYLKESLPRRIDKRNLYLRVGKQELYLGKMVLKEKEDMVKIKIGFKSGHKLCQLIEKLLIETEEG